MKSDMSNIRNIIRRIIVLGVILLFAAGSAESDFGSFSGNSDYSRSSSYSSGSSSNSSRSSTSYNSPSSRSSSGSGTGTFRVPVNSGGWSNAGIVRNHNSDGFDEDDEDETSGAIFALIFFAVMLYLFIRSRKKAKHDRQVFIEENAPKVILQPMDEYTKLDPNFDASELCSHVANLYVQMQDAWGAKNLEILRPYLADAFYNQMNRQLDEFRKTNRTDHTERIAVLNVILKGFRRANGMDYVIAGLTSRITSYVTDDLTGKVISGSKERELFMEYELELSRKSGILTEHDHDQIIKSETCPNCGAPIDVNATAKCPYCGSIIRSKNITWAVCNMQGLSQKSA